MAQLHYGDQEARRADVDQADESVKLQGEGYGVLPNDQKKSFSSSPQRSSEAPLKVQHKRNDPIYADDQKSPPSYGNLDGKPEDAGKASPASGYGGQLGHIAKPQEEGYTSLGIESSVDENSSDHSQGVPSEEDYKMKEREGDPQESMAKKLEDHPAAGGGMIDVHSLKVDYVDLSEGNPNQVKAPTDDPKQEASCPHDDDKIHDSETFKGDDGEEKIKVEGYNIYSGEPEKTLYDAEDVLGNQHGNEISVTDDAVAHDLRETVTKDDQPHYQHGSFHGMRRDEQVMPHELQSVDQPHHQAKVEEDQDEGVDGSPRDKEAVLHDLRSGHHQPHEDFDGACRDKQATLDELHHVFQDEAEDKSDDQITAHDILNHCLRHSADQHQDEAIKPSENSGAQDESSPQVMPDVPKRVKEYEQDQPGEPKEPHEDFDDACRDKQATLDELHRVFQDEAEDKSDDQITAHDILNHCLRHSADQPQDKAIKPSEDLGAQDESSPQVMPDVPKRVKEYAQDQPGEPKEKDNSADVRVGTESRDFSESGTKDALEEQFTEHMSSPIEQDAGLKVDSEDRDVDNELVNKQGSDQASKGENIENESANEASPYTKFDCNEDYVKAGYGGEGFVAQNNDEIDKELRKPIEKGEQEEERRPTDKQPLDDKTHEGAMLKQGDAEGNEKRASEGDAYGTKEGRVGDEKGFGDGKDDGGVNDEQSEYVDVPPAGPTPQADDVYVRPPSMPHPQPQDLAEKNEYRDNTKGDEEDHNHEASQKKGMFERIKEKFTSSN